MRFHTKTIVLITMALILYGCCRTTKCIQVTQEDTNPVASIKITYKDDAGTYQRITRRFDGSTSSMNYNLELPHNTDWKAYFKATSSSFLKPNGVMSTTIYNNILSFGRRRISVLVRKSVGTENWNSRILCTAMYTGCIYTLKILIKKIAGTEMYMFVFLNPSKNLTLTLAPVPIPNRTVNQAGNFQ